MTTEERGCAVSGGGLGSSCVGIFLTLLPAQWDTLALANREVAQGQKNCQVAAR